MNIAQNDCDDWPKFFENHPEMDECFKTTFNDQISILAVWSAHLELL